MMSDRSMVHVDFRTISTASEADVICDLSIQMDSVIAKIKLHLDREKYLQRSLFYFGEKGSCYESDYTSIMLKVLKPADTFIDIGANIGYFSMLASSLVSESGRVISLEPEKENFNYLVRNIELNQFKNITALNIAAGNIKKEVDLFIDPLNDGGHSLSGITPETIQQIGSKEVVTSRVQMDTLDSLLATETISNIKIIKIDTEGWEFNTILGAVSVIKKYSPPFILAEVNRSGLRRAGASERYLRLLMNELGYSAYMATCLANKKLVLELIPTDCYFEPTLEHYNYNAVFARPESLYEYSTINHIFD